jgi:RND family efflux transporter MFP subunit
MILQGVVSRQPGDSQPAHGNIDGREATPLWDALSEPLPDQDFFRAWLAIQCGLVTRARAGLLLIDQGSEQYAVAAAWPDGKSDVSHLAAAAGPALQQRKSIVHYPSAAAGPPNSVCVAHPIEVEGKIRAVVIVQIGKGTADDLQATVRRLHWGGGGLEARLRRVQAKDDAARLKRMAFAMDMLANAGERPALHACAIAVANDLAVRLRCARVSIGMTRRNRVRLTAISNSATFDEKADVVEAIENAMEEALFQHKTVTVPAAGASDRQLVSLAHQQLAKLAADTSLASVVFTSGNRAIGVMTLERDSEAAFDTETIHLLEALAHLIGPTFEMKADLHRLVSGRIVDRLRSGTRALLGPRRPAVKIGTALVLAVLAYAVMARGEFKISGKAAVEGAIQRAAVAPFDGYISTAPVRAGDIVVAGQVLATLDDRDLSLELLRAKAEYEQQAVQYDDAMAQRDPSATRLAAAAMAQAKAQLEQAADRVERSRIQAPFSGVVVSGDLRQKLGSPVEKGQLLFQLSPLDSFRAVLQIDERDIAFVSPGQSGQLILAGVSDAAETFKVRTITPVANAAEGTNFFLVEAEIENASGKLRPGLEGIGKISVDRRGLLWIWTRRLADWAQITAWKWTP